MVIYEKIRYFPKKDIYWISRGVWFIFGYIIFIECICRSNGDVNIDNKEIVGFEWIYPEKALELDNLGRFARKVINRYIETKTIDSSRKKNLL